MEHNRNKIILFTYDFMPNNGGIARLLLGIYSGLKRLKKEVLVITCAKGPEEVDIIRIPYSKRGLLDLRMYLTLKKFFKRGDIIITDTWHPAGRMAACISNEVYILTHGAELLPGSGLRNSWVWRKYRENTLLKAKGVISNSRYTDSLVKACSAKIRHIAIPLFVDTNYFYPLQYDKDSYGVRLCSLSRLEKFKGHDFILKTIAQLPENYRNKIIFEIGGSGIYKKELEQLTEDLGLSKNVKFCGFIPENQLREFYNRNNLFILTSREEPENINVEGFGLVFLEAQACGLPVIGSLTGGISDSMINGRTGWQIQPDNYKQLSELLMKIIDNPGILKKFSKEANNFAIKNNTETYLKKLLDFIK